MRRRWTRCWSWPTGPTGWRRWAGLDGSGGSVETLATSFVDPSPLVAAVEPRDALVARCACGEEACRVLVARITRVGGEVVWDRFRIGSTVMPDVMPIEAPTLRFDAVGYDAVLGGAGPVSSWEPTSRRAALLAQEDLRRRDPTILPVRGPWVSDLGDDLMVGAMHGDRGSDDRVWLHAPVERRAAEGPEALAQRAVAMITSGALFTDPAVDRQPMGRRRT